MKTKLHIAIGLAGLLLAGCAGLDTSDRVFIVGDVAYIDGHRVSREQYEAAEANGTLAQLEAQLNAQANPRSAAAVPPVAVAPAPLQAAPAASAMVASHAAVCNTASAYDAYPGDNALFNCNAGLGTLTRAQLLAQGWKVDMMEKTPVVGGKLSPRGLPLFTYQLVLSR